MAMRECRLESYIWLCMSVTMATLVTACSQEKVRHSYFSEYKPFGLEDRSHFSRYKEVVGSYLHQKAPGVDTHACVLGLTRGPRDTEAVWVIWREGDRVIRWFAGEDNLDLSPRNLSLTNDIVPTDADIGTSTYLESQPWVDELERLCEEHGHDVTATD